MKKKDQEHIWCLETKELDSPVKGKLMRNRVPTYEHLCIHSNLLSEKFVKCIFKKKKKGIVEQLNLTQWSEN